MRMSNSMGILHKIFAILPELEMNTKLTRLVIIIFQLTSKVSKSSPTS